jgi:hypothetical protein
MSEHLRRLMAELATQAPDRVDRDAIRRVVRRRRSAALLGVTAFIGVCGVTAAIAMQPGTGPETLQPAPFATSSTSPTAEPVRVPLPAQFLAADGSRVASYRTFNGVRIEWLSSEEPGYGATSLAMSKSMVLYTLGNAEAQHRDVRGTPYPARSDSGTAHFSEPGGFLPAVLPNLSRYAFLLGDDASYSPRPTDLRLVLYDDAGGGVQAVYINTDWLIGGLSFAGKDRLALATKSAGDGSGLSVYDFRTDEFRLGSRTPDSGFLAAPLGCDWTLPTATPDPDQVLLLEKCARDDGGDSEAIVVDVTTGERLSTFAVVRPAGPGQVDSLDLDASGQLIIAQIHGGALPPSSAEPGGPTAAGLVTTQLGGGRTLTTTELYVSPVWD